MVSWGELEHERPDLASKGRAILYQFGVGLGFLATVALDGRPRVHPICPVLSDDALFAFIVPSPKQGDLRRDGRYSLHSFPCPDNEDAFYLAGTARLVEDHAAREHLGAQFVLERSSIGVELPSGDHLLFELGIESCLLTSTSGHGDPSPRHVVWRPPGSGAT